MTWVTFNVGKFLIIFINMSNYYSSRAPEFTPGFCFLVGSVLLIFVVLCVLLCFCTFWVSCCDVSYDFRIKTMFGPSLPPGVRMRPHVLFTLFVFVCV